MKVTFHKKEVLIDHDDFCSLNTSEIELDCCIPVDFLGETKEIESYDSGYEEYHIEGHSFSKYDLEEYGTVDGEYKAIDVSGDDLQLIGDEFHVGCKQISQKEMLEIVNFVIDTWGYAPVKLP